MNIYNFMNEKMNRALNGENTKIVFPGLRNIKRNKKFIVKQKVY